MLQASVEYVACQSPGITLNWQQHPHKIKTKSHGIGVPVVLYLVKISANLPSERDAVRFQQAPQPPAGGPATESHHHRAVLLMADNDSCSLQMPVPHVRQS